jgi:hypothetical protein
MIFSSHQSTIDSTMGKLALDNQHGVICQDGALAGFHDGNLARIGLPLA